MSRSRRLKITTEDDDIMEWYFFTLIIIPIVIVVVIIMIFVIQRCRNSTHQMGHGCLSKIKKTFPFYLCVKKGNLKKEKSRPYFANTFEVIGIFNRNIITEFEQETLFDLLNGVVS